MEARHKKFDEIYSASIDTLNSFLVENLPINIFLVDKEGFVCWANKNLLNHVNIPSVEKARGLHVSAWGDIRWRYMQEVIATKRETITEEKYAETYFSVIRKPIIKGSEVIAVLGISIDITDRKKAEIAKTEFLENIRHDVRTPLSGIVSMAVTARKRASDPILKQIMDSLTTSSHAFLHLIDEILEAVHSSTGSAQPQQKEFSLQKTLESVIQVHQATASSKQLTLLLDCDSVLPALLIGDALRIKRIALELVTNALKYTRQGHVRVSARLAKQEAQSIAVQISVEDTGIGISADKHQAIFEKFTRLKPAYQGHHLGTGLGLANVQRLVDELGGEIKLDSKSDQGATFIYTLPLRLPPLEKGEAAFSMEARPTVAGN